MKLVLGDQSQQGELLHCVICEGMTYHQYREGEWICNAYEGH